MAAMTGSAAASSFVTFGDPAPASTPSIVVMGAPDPVQAVATAVEETAAPADPPQQALRQMTPGSWMDAPVAATAEMQVISPSVIALGEPLPPVTYEKVASIPKKPLSKANFAPMVIRGGIVGDAFTPASTPGTQQASAQPRSPSNPASQDKSEPIIVERTPVPEAQ